MRYVALVGGLLLSGASLKAQSAADTCGTQSYTVADDGSRARVLLRDQALQAARSKFLSVLGVQVSNTISMNRQAVGESSATVSLQGSTTQELTGWITRDTVESWSTADQGAHWDLRWSGCARRNTGRADEAFKLTTARLDKNPATYAYTSPADRDSIVVVVQVSKPAYITVVSRSEDDSVNVLYPNARLGTDRRTLLMPGDSLVIPPGARVRVGLPASANSTFRTIFVAATKEDVPLGPISEGSRPTSVGTMSFQQYVAWFNSIAMDARTQAELHYTVQRTKR